MVSITDVSAVVAAAGVLVGVVYYLLDLRHETRLRQTDIIMRLNSQYNSESFQRAIERVLGSDFRDFDDFVKKYVVSSQDDVLISFRMIGSFFEGVGVLYSEGLIDINVVRKLFTVDIYWDKIKPLVVGMRKRENKPALYEWSEHLYDAIKKIEAQDSRVPRKTVHF